MQQASMDAPGTGAVYVQTNAAPNEVIAFRRAAEARSTASVASPPAVTATACRT